MHAPQRMSEDGICWKVQDNGVLDGFLHQQHPLHFFVGFTTWFLADQIIRINPNSELKGVQGSAKRWSPGCVIVAGKARQK